MGSSGWGRRAATENTVAARYRSGVRRVVGLHGPHLALECRWVVAPRLVSALGHRVGEDVLLVGREPVEDGGRHVGRAGLRDVEAADHVGVHRAREDAMHT